MNILPPELPTSTFGAAPSGSTFGNSVPLHSSPERVDGFDFFRIGYLRAAQQIALLPLDQLDRYAEHRMAIRRRYIVRTGHDLPFLAGRALAAIIAMVAVREYACDWTELAEWADAVQECHTTDPLPRPWRN